MPTPQSHLIAASKQYRDAWRLADVFRADPELPSWPEWCFLPMGAWYAIVCQAHGVNRLTTLPLVGDISRLAALGAWRPTQDIFRFEPELYDAVDNTPLDGDMPCEVLYRLPTWCVYIETPSLTFDKKTLDGFFVHLEKDANNGDEELRFLFAYQDGALEPFPLHIGPWPLAEGLSRSLAVSSFFTDRRLSYGENTAKVMDTLRHMLNLTLYLCSDTPDASNGVEDFRPHHPTPKKTKQGLRLFPPDTPRLWQVGRSVAERLRSFRAEDAPHKGPRPHIRRAHWHGFWEGPKKSKEGQLPPDGRRFTVKWLPPIFVAMREDEQEADPNRMP